LLLQSAAKAPKIEDKLEGRFSLQSSAALNIKARISEEFHSDATFRDNFEKTTQRIAIVDKLKVSVVEPNCPADFTMSNGSIVSLPSFLTGGKLFRKKLECWYGGLQFR
jgi:hypothetical protein